MASFKLILGIAVLLCVLVQLIEARKSKHKDVEVESDDEVVTHKRKGTKSYSKHGRPIHIDLEEIKGRTIHQSNRCPKGKRWSDVINGCKVTRTFKY